MHDKVQNLFWVSHHASSMAISDRLVFLSRLV